MLPISTHLSEIRKVTERAKVGHNILKTLVPDYLKYLFQDIAEVTMVDIDEFAGPDAATDALKTGDVRRLLSLIPAWKELFGSSSYVDLAKLGVYHPDSMESPISVIVWTSLIVEDYKRFNLYLVEVGAQPGPYISEYEYFDVDYMEQGVKYREGANYIDQEKLAEQIGATNMLALHTLYHEIGPDAFHSFLVGQYDHYQGYDYHASTPFHHIEVKEKLVKPKENDEWEPFFEELVIPPEFKKAKGEFDAGLPPTLDGFDIFFAN